jgi:uncharacterized protein (DUF2235 family)
MKHLIICFDGTWNAADSEHAETNVALMARAVHANQNTDGIAQIVLYLRGVGSSGLEVQRIFAGAVGQGVDDNIRSAYMFLAQNYVPGDKIFIFGFSRGAFSARSLAGFVGSCGLLRRQRLGDIRKAWTYYRTVKKRSPEKFVTLYSSDSHVDVEIEFVGVWDTVGALGIPSHIFTTVNQREYGFHNTTPSTITKHAYHALAIDELRDEFVPTLWTGKLPDGCVMEQVWFAGAHSDVGGGYADRTLADIPLVWMAQKAEACGLVLDWSMLPDPARLNPFAPYHNSRNSFSRMDRLSPTFRQVCEQPIDVSFYETLYRPIDANRRPLTTVNESLHSSVIDRFGQTALFSKDDTAAGRVTEIYEPRNLRPLFAARAMAAE